jgi:rubrerythrin
MNSEASDYYYPCVGKSFLNDLVKAVNGEYAAISCYRRLAKQAPSAEAKKQILEIRDDEIRHFRTFSGIYFTLTGRKPSPQITEKCPEDYRQGLEASFKDEQETVDFYHDVAAQALESYIKEQFQRAAADEQNHAVWFLYYYLRKC